MEIERINENTVKFYISYLDIEDRGFKREEIWYNREKSEQLFWQMMEELNYKEDFAIEGPLWIQVQALEKGLEVIVTRAQVNKDEEDLLDLFSNRGGEDDHDEDRKRFLNNETIKEVLEEQLESKEDSRFKNMFDPDNKNNFSIIFTFDEFEDVIQLSHSFNEVADDIKDKLYYYKDKYHLYMEFSQFLFDDETQEDLISLTLEYATEAKVTVHVLEAYGKVIIENDVFSQIRSFFPA